MPNPEFGHPEHQATPQTPDHRIHEGKGLTPEETEHLIRTLRYNEWDDLARPEYAATLQKAAASPEMRTLARQRIMDILTGDHLPPSGFEEVVHAFTDPVHDPELATAAREAFDRAREKGHEAKCAVFTHALDIPEGITYARSRVLDAIAQRRWQDITMFSVLDLSSDPEVSAALEGCISDDLDRAEDFVAVANATKPLVYLCISDTFKGLPNVQQAFRRALTRLHNGALGMAQKDAVAHACARLRIGEEERRAIGERIIRQNLTHERTSDIPETVKQFDVPPTIVAAIGKEKILERLAEGRSDITNILETCNVSVNDPEVQTGVRDAIARAIDNRKFGIARNLADHLVPNRDALETIFDGALRTRTWETVRRMLATDDVVPTQEALREAMRTLAATEIDIPSDILERLPFDFSHLPITDEQRRRGAQHPDTAVYESVRTVRNVSLRQTLWATLLGPGNHGIVADAPRNRTEEYPRLPPHLFGAFVASGYEHPALLRSLDAFVAAHDGKAGATRTMQRLEYDLTLIAREAEWFGADHLLRETIPSLITDPDGDADAVVGVVGSLRHLLHIIRPLFAGQKPSQEHWNALTHGATTLADLQRQIDTEIRDAMPRLFGIAITERQYAATAEEWNDDFRSLIILSGKYAAGHREGIPLFQETLRAVFEQRWGDFRYDMTNPTVAEQLGYLTTAERKDWIDNAPPQNIGEMTVERNDTPERQRDMIREHIRSGLDQGHLTSYQILETSAQHDIALMLRGVLDGTLTHADIDDERRALGIVLGERTFVGKAADLANIDRASLETTEGLAAAAAELKGMLDVPLPADANAKAKGKRGLQQQLAGWIGERQTLGFEREKAIRTALQITDNIGQKDLACLRDDRDLVRDIARLLALDDDELRQRNLKDKNGVIKQEDALRALLTRISAALKKRESAFAQDIDNIAMTLFTAPAAPQQFRDLTIEEEDDPKTLFEAGHYPIGCGSCQNFEGDVQYNKCLLAYVADADKKILTIRKPDRTILARAIIKLGRTDDATQTPIIFLEPTYTSVNKQDHNFDDDINRYIIAKAGRMGRRVRVVRGALTGDVGVRIATSRNGYQYEDGGAGAADAAGLGIKYGAYTMNAYEIEGQAPQSTPPEKRVRAVRRRQGAQEALRTPA